MRDGWICDATALKDFRACPELFRNRHVLGLVPEDRLCGSAEASIAIHAGLQRWFADEGLDAAKAEALQVWGEDPLFLPEKAKWTSGYIEAVLDGYAKAWPREGDPFEVVDNEHYFEKDFGSFKWCGRIDRGIRFPGEATMPMDTKGTGMYWGDRLFQRHALSTQLRGYCLEYGTNTCYVDHIQFDTRYHKVKPEHFAREQVRFTAGQLSQWRDDVAYDLYRMKILEMDMEPWPQNDDQCCRYGRCQYFEKCVYGLDGGFTVKFWEPNNVE